MSSSQQATVASNVITLRGSTEIVKEFFNYSVNNILYQRGIYPPESFKRVSQYGLSIMVTTDEGLVTYMTNILRQLEGTKVLIVRPNFNHFKYRHNIIIYLIFAIGILIISFLYLNLNFMNYLLIEWLTNGSVQKLILVVKGTETGDTLERWVFDVECKHAASKENLAANSTDG